MGSPLGEISVFSELLWHFFSLHAHFFIGEWLKIWWCLTLKYKSVLGMKSIPKLPKRDLQATQTWPVCEFSISYHHF